MSISKTDTLNRLIIAVVVSIFVAALVAHTCIPLLAIASGFVAGLGATLGFMGYKDKRSLLIEALCSLVGSQMGWVALLI